MTETASNTPTRGKRATTIIKKAFDDYQKQHSLAPNSIVLYSKYVGQFGEFCKEKGDGIRRLTQAGIEEYQEYLMQKGDSNNSVNRKTECIRRLINDGILNKAKLGLTKVSTARLAVQKTKTDDKARRPLTDAEVRQLENCKGLSPRLREWADLFLLQIYCGCRNSDLHRLFDPSKHTITDRDGVKLLTFKTTKSQGTQTAQVMVTQKIEAILNRYSGGFKYVKFGENNRNFTHAHTNNVKRFSQQAGLDSIENFVEDGKQKSAPLYEVIGGHFARYTFVHNKIAEGYTPEEIAPMTGHTDGNMIRQIYGVLDNEERTMQTINTIKKVQGRNAAAQADNKAFGDLKEFQDVLRFFGCPYDDFKDITDTQELFRMIVARYEIPLTTEFDYTTKQLKEAYNNKDWAEQDRMHQILYNLHSRLR